GFAGPAASPLRLRVTDLVGDLLRRVSRSFYLSLAILPSSLREPIGLAYLLARASDTVADTRLLPPPERPLHLATLIPAYAGRRACGEAGRLHAPGRAGMEWAAW